MCRIHIFKKKNLESKNEITNTNNNEFVNISTSLYCQKSDNSHMLKWKSFKCVLVTVMMSDDQQRHCAAKFYVNGRSSS